MALVVEHHEELERDLLPDVDLLDVWRGRMSFRRLGILIGRLQPESAFISALDPEGAVKSSWGIAEYQRALLIDMFGKANFQNWKPLPRPAQIVEERKRTEDRHRALIERFEARQRAQRPRAKRRAS